MCFLGLFTDGAGSVFGKWRALLTLPLRDVSGESGEEPALCISFLVCLPVCLSFLSFVSLFLLFFLRGALQQYLAHVSVSLLSSLAASPCPSLLSLSLFLA